MKPSEIISNKINRFRVGFIFTSDDFSGVSNNRESITKLLGKLVANGKISRLSKGKYYKAKPISCKYRGNDFILFMLSINI